jgi:hypothetical protein
MQVEMQAILREMKLAEDTLCCQREWAVEHGRARTASRVQSAVLQTTEGFVARGAEDERPRSMVPSRTASR